MEKLIKNQNKLENHKKNKKDKELDTKDDEIGMKKSTKNKF